MLLSSLGFVEASEAAVVALVQPPRFLHGQVGLPRLLEDSGQGRLCPLEDGSVRNIKSIAILLERLATRDSLGDT